MEEEDKLSNSLTDFEDMMWKSQKQKKGTFNAQRPIW